MDIIEVFNLNNQYAKALTSLQNFTLIPIYNEVKEMQFNKEILLLSNVIIIGTLREYVISCVFNTFFTEKKVYEF